jgi:hypothetical protein
VPELWTVTDFTENILILRCFNPPQIQYAMKDTSKYVHVHQDHVSTPAVHLLQSLPLSTFTNEINTEAMNGMPRKLIMMCLSNPYLVLFTHSSVV